MIVRDEINMMREVVQYLREEGFTREFRVSARGIEDPRTRRIYQPEDLTIQRIYRFEGDNKLPNLDVLYALQARDGVRGWIAGARDGYPIKQITELVSRMRGVSSN